MRRCAKSETRIMTFSLYLHSGVKPRETIRCIAPVPLTARISIPPCCQQGRPFPQQIKIFHRVRFIFRKACAEMTMRCKNTVLRAKLTLIKEIAASVYRSDFLISNQRSN